MTKQQTNRSEKPTMQSIGLPRSSDPVWRLGNNAAAIWTETVDALYHEGVELNQAVVMADTILGVKS